MAGRRYGLELTMMTRAFIATLLSVALSVGPGCSFAFTRNPKPPPASPDCTTSRASPVLDIVSIFLAVPIAGGLAYAAADEEGEDDEDAAGTAMGLAMIVTLTAYVASSVTGFKRTSRCRAARARGSDSG